MYLYLILALVLMALPVYLIVGKRWADDDDNHLFKPDVRVALLVASGSISGAFFAVVLVCYQAYSHLWLGVLPLLSGGSLYSLFRKHATAAQAKSSLIGLFVGLPVGWFAAVLVMAITFESALAPGDYYVDLLSDDNAGVRWRKMAAEILGQLGDRRAVDPLIKALSHHNYDVRQAAAEALGQLGDDRAVDPLSKALADDDRWVRLAAAEALGQLGDKQAADSLINALSDNYFSVRRTAAKALGELGDKRAVDPLVKALSDDSSDVRKAAKTALKKLGYEE